MSLYIGKNSKDAVDLIANNGNETLVKQVLKKHYLPPIGSVKLIARSSIPAIPGVNFSENIYHRIPNTFFAGWVVADGSYYLKADFREAFEVFGDRYGAGNVMFRIPNLLNFYRLNNKNIVQQTPEQPCKSILVDHQHEIDCDISLSFSGKIKNSLSCVTTSGYGSVGAICQRDATTTINGKVGDDITLPQLTEAGAIYEDAIPAFHNGQGSWNLMTSPLTINIDADFSTMNTNYAGSNADCWPSNKSVIPMIYIGADV